MATGTGKTYTAFQIVYRLWKAKVKKRILYLADRKVLISQTKNNDFRHFGDKIENTEVLSIDPLTALWNPAGNNKYVWNKRKIS